VGGNRTYYLFLEVNMEEKKIYYLDKNENLYGPSPKVYTLLKEIEPKLLNSYERGTLCLISEIAKRYGVSEDSIILGYGAEDILKTAMERGLNPYDKVMLPRYSWWYYVELAKQQNSYIVYAPITKDKNEFYYDIETITYLIKKEWPRVILIATPNNPTGNILSLEEVISLLNVSGDALFVLDLAYAGFMKDDEILNEIGNLVSTYPNLMAIFTFSKLYALAGIRVGYAILGKDVRKKLRYTERLLGFNRISALIAATALKDDNYYKKIAQKMIKDREIIYETLLKLPAFRPFKSYANFLLSEVEESLIPYLKKNLTERGIIIKFFKEVDFPNTIRITIGTEEATKLLLAGIETTVKERYNMEYDVEMEV